ncbi:MAG: histidine kinase [Treponema sp.]|nr:histidine kinase [Treponema sp.]
MIKRKIRFSIRRKIFITIMIVSIVPVILFSIASISITYSTMRTQMISSRSLSMDWLYDRLSLDVRSYTNQFYEYEVNRELKSSIINWAYGNQTDHITQSRIRNNFETTLSIDPSIRSIEIYSLISKDGLVSNRASFYSVLRDHNDNIWNTRNPNAQTNVVFNRDDEDLLIMHQTNNFTTGQGAAVIIFRIRMNVLGDILEKVKSDLRETVILLNDDNNVLITNSGIEDGFDMDTLPELLTRFNDSAQESIQADKALIFHKSVSNEKLRIVYIVPDVIIMQTLRQTTSIAVIILMFSMLAAILLSIMFSKIISKPIIQLSNKMQTSSIWDIADTDRTNRHDEIGFLQESFGTMIRRNQDLIANEIQSSQEKCDAQIRALQAQINPHFIYNTLQVIGGMALNNDTDNIYSIAVTLSDIMRYSFNFSQEMVPLKKEIEYLEGYLAIQNHRFSDCFNFKTDIPERLLEAYIPKMILQPIVENCFEHGFSEKAGEKSIELTALEGEIGSMTISITDNGAGILSKRIEEIKEQLRLGSSGAIGSSSHIGLNNVNSRLHLRYGGNYGVNIDSEEGKGTTVIIHTKLSWEAET